MIEVIKSGIFSSVQDQGRFGYAHLGVPYSGAMDAISAQLANEIVGNSSEDAVVELTLVGGVFKFMCDTVIAITGADMQPVLNENPVSLNKRLLVKQGDILAFSKAQNGCRAYLAVAGGIQTPIILGSRSYFVPVTKNSALKKGDIIAIKLNQNIYDNEYAKIKNSTFQNLEIAVFPGPEFECLGQKQKQLLLETEFTVSNLNNRMGYQLNELITNKINPIITSAVLPGTLQLTPGGALIVLMRDAQTTGGYPRILQLTDMAINVMAQKKAGDNISFTLIEMKNNT